jgi:hypothetical protein
MLDADDLQGFMFASSNATLKCSSNAVACPCASIYRFNLQCGIFYSFLDLLTSYLSSY